MIPSSTYRIQFRNGMTFDRVADLIPYMKDLSAIFTRRLFSPQPRIPPTAMT